MQEFVPSFLVGGEGEGSGQKPGDGSNSVYRPGEDRYPAGDRFRPGGDRFRPGSGGIAGDRYPPRYPPPGRYPPSSGGYDDRIPVIGRPPIDRYPDYDEKYIL